MEMKRNIVRDSVCAPIGGLAAFIHSHDFTFNYSLMHSSKASAT